MSDTDFAKKQKAKRLVKVQIMNRYRRKQLKEYIASVKHNS